MTLGNERIVLIYFFGRSETMSKLPIDWSESSDRDLRAVSSLPRDIFSHATVSTHNQELTHVSLYG